MGTIYKDGINYSGGGSGNTNSIALTQAEYDALSEAEKNSDIVYFITDAIGSTDGLFFAYYNYPGKPNPTWAEVKQAWDDKRSFVVVGSAGNIRSANATYFNSTSGDERIEVFFMDENGNNASTISRPDDSWVLTSAGDSGWIENGVLQYRKKNGFVTLNLVSVFNSAIVPGSNTLGTLPVGYRPAFSNQGNRIDFAAIVTPTGVTTDKTACNVGIATDGIVTLFSPKDIPATTGIRGCVTYPV